MTKPDGSMAMTAMDEAQTLKDFFASVFTVEDLKNVSSAPSFHVNEVLSSILISLAIGKRRLKALNPNKSPRHDIWYPYFLRE